MSSDNLQKFIFEHQHIRGAIIHLQHSYQKIIEQRPYPAMVRFLLGEALASALLLTSSIKFEGQLSLQFQGADPLSLILIQTDHLLRVRAMASCQPGQLDEAYAKAFLEGKMVITIQADHQAKAYQSIVPLLSTSMSENLAHYFAQSEQIATQVWLAAGNHSAAGMLLQLMPGDSSEEREQFWEYALAMGQTVSERELLELDNETLLHRLYHETDVRIFEPEPVQFHCRCDSNKMKQVLTTLGKADLQKLLDEKKVVSVCCEFCNQQYDFDAIDIEMLFRD